MTPRKERLVEEAVLGPMPTDLLSNYPGPGPGWERRGLRFTDLGAHRLASIHGWIQGLRDSVDPEALRMAQESPQAGARREGSAQEDFAVELYTDLRRKLLAISTVRMIMFGDEEHPLWFPARICEVADDGSKHCFALQWWNFDPDAVLANGHDKRMFGSQGGISPIYKMGVNGGLFYHGPKHIGEYSKGGVLWEVHT